MAFLLKSIKLFLLLSEFDTCFDHISIEAIFAIIKVLLFSIKFVRILSYEVIFLFHLVMMINMLDFLYVI